MTETFKISAVWLDSSAASTYLALVVRYEIIHIRNIHQFNVIADKHCPHITCMCQSRGDISDKNNNIPYRCRLHPFTYYYGREEESI